MLQNWFDHLQWQNLVMMHMRWKFLSKTTCFKAISHLIYYMLGFLFCHSFTNFDYVCNQSIACNWIAICQRTIWIYSRINPINEGLQRTIITRILTIVSRQNTYRRFHRNKYYAMRTHLGLMTLMITNLHNFFRRYTKCYIERRYKCKKLAYKSSH